MEQNNFAVMFIMMVISAIALIVLAMWGLPKYKVYSMEMHGIAVLAEAESSRQVAVREALIKLGWTPPKGSVKRIGLLIVHPGLSAGDLKGLEWDEVWIHPDVKYGVAKEILNINPKAKQVVW